MTNSRLSKKITEWQKSGNPEQEAFDWSKSRSNWYKDIPSLENFMDKLPKAITRKDVRNITENNKTNTIEKFLATMIWGYGNLGYGSYRVKKMFAAHGFEEKIGLSYELARTGLVLEAYEYLSKNRIQQLGPAYGTKWLSFVSPISQPAPIYDSFIAMWIEKYAKNDFAQIRTSSEVWNKQTYSAYYEWMNSNSNVLGVKTDDLELVIFQDATSEFATKSKWKGL